MRSSEHAAHRLLMHSGHTSHFWLKVSPCVSFHVIHACALVCCSLSVSPHPSFYFLVLFLFQLYLMSNSAPDEFSIEDPPVQLQLGEHGHSGLCHTPHSFSSEMGCKHGRERLGIREKGITPDVAKKARSQLIREVNFFPARALDVLVCGAINEPHFLADGSISNQLLPLDWLPADKLTECTEARMRDGW